MTDVTDTSVTEPKRESYYWARLAAINFSRTGLDEHRECVLKHTKRLLPTLTDGVKFLENVLAHRGYTNPSYRTWLTILREEGLLPQQKFPWETL